MGNTIEQHRSAIGRFKPPGCRQVSRNMRREEALSEVMTILAEVKIKQDAKQVDTEFPQTKQN